MSLRLFRLAAGVFALAVSANGLYTSERQGGAFSVQALAPLAPEEFDPTAELQRLRAKYPVATPANAKEVRSERQTGSAKVNPSSSGLSYFVPTVVGDQTFQLIYDTGSADLWVYSNESSPYQSLEHPTYVPKSSAELLPNSTWAIEYAFGQEASGVVYKDTVQAGPVIASKQAVQAATVIQFAFASDGILGLASSTINTVQPESQKTFFETLLPTLANKLFAANLRIDGQPATWDFGYIDESHYEGEITYTPVTSSKYWSMNITSYAIGEASFSNTESIDDVILDSGTSLIYLPDAVVNEYYSHIEGYEHTIGGSHTFPCNATVPDLNFQVGETTLSVPGRDINYATYDSTRGICAGGLMTQLNMKYSVLGNLFMRNYYVIHSLEEATPKLGFARH